MVFLLSVSSEHPWALPSRAPRGKLDHEHLLVLIVSRGGQGSPVLLAASLPPPFRIVKQIHLLICLTIRNGGDTRLLDYLCIDDRLLPSGGSGVVVRGTSVGSFNHSLDTGVGRALLDPADGDFKGGRVVVPYFGNCTTPVRMAHPLGREVEYGVRCRVCPGCRRARQFLWKLRSEAEILSSHGSYLFTGTFRAQFHDLEPVAREVTLWLKRLRSFHEAGSVRYFVAYERHKSGAWHIHANLHDAHATAPKLQHLSGVAWRAGFHNCKAVDLKGAGYVAKYVSKEMAEGGSGTQRPRIRASRSPSYGWQVMQRDEEIVRELQKRGVDRERAKVINLLDLFRWMDRKDNAWKQATNSVQMNGPLLLGTEHRPVDRETGEILPF